MAMKGNLTQMNDFQCHVIYPILESYGLTAELRILSLLLSHEILSAE